MSELVVGRLAYFCKQVIENYFQEEINRYNFTVCQKYKKD